VVSGRRSCRAGLELEYLGGVLTSGAPVRVRAALLAVWRGELEDAGFNRLLFAAGLTGREIVVLRACCASCCRPACPSATHRWSARCC
jgi:NAD-specific glutamate dehydrogenase